MVQEKEIFDFLFQKIKSNKNSKCNLIEFTFEIQSTISKLQEILKPFYISKSKEKNFIEIFSTNQEEKNILELLYFLSKTLNTYFEIDEMDKKTILKYLNK